MRTDLAIHSKVLDLEMHRDISPLQRFLELTNSNSCGIADLCCGGSRGIQTIGRRKWGPIWVSCVALLSFIKCSLWQKLPRLPVIATDVNVLQSFVGVVDIWKWLTCGIVVRKIHVIWMSVVLNKYTNFCIAIIGNATFNWHTMDLLWEKFQWILPLYMKPISFQSKASVVCSVTAAIFIDFFLKTLNVFSQHICQKTNEYLNSAQQMPKNWNVDQLSMLITSWDIT